MRLIDADALAKKLTDWSTGTVEPIDWSDIAEAPTIDAVEVVRCRDCKYASPNGKIGCQLMPFSCHDKKRSLYANGFCSYGERKERVDEN